MKLRWLHRQPPPLTAKMVREYADQHQVSINEAKSALRPISASTVLQQWDEVNACWIDIPTIIEVIE